MITNEQLAKIRKNKGRRRQGGDPERPGGSREGQEAEGAAGESELHPNQAQGVGRPSKIDEARRERGPALRIPGGAYGAGWHPRGKPPDTGRSTRNRRAHGVQTHQTLVTMKSIIVLKMGTANVYCMDPAEVWKSYNNAKPYAAFNTRTLVSKSENPFVRRRLAVLLDGKEPEEKKPARCDGGHEDEDTGIDFNDFAEAAE